ncbi:MAG TPA: NUDIX domain-containing protein [Oculatellaceae cyanobacterium]
MNCCPICGNNLTNSEIGGRDRLVCVNVQCEFVNWDNPKPVTATLVPYEGGLVLVQRKFEPYTGYWCLPGGFIENCEHPAESAAREVFEETGLTIHNHKLLDAVAPGRNINVVILFYEAASADGPLCAGDDASDVRSFKHDDLPPNVAFELHRKAISNWFEVHQGKKAILKV